MTEADDIRARMQDICDEIMNAVTTVESGAMVQLSGLDNRVARLCSRTLALPAADAADIQPLMADMINSLDRLGMALRDYQDRVHSGKAG